MDSAVIKSRLNRSESVSELLGNMVRLGDDAGNATLFGVPEKLHDSAAAVASMAKEAHLWRGTIMAAYREREEYTIAEHRASMVRIPVSLINSQDFAKKLNRACCEGVQKVINYYDLESIANTLIRSEQPAEKISGLQKAVRTEINAKSEKVRAVILNSAAIRSRLNGSRNVSELLENMVKLGDVAGTDTPFHYTKDLYGLAAGVVAMTKTAHVWKGTIMASFLDRDNYTIVESPTSPVKIPSSLVDNQAFAGKLSGACCNDVPTVTNYYGLADKTNLLIGKESKRSVRRL